MTRAQREALVLDTAARLFYARGVHEVGMDELVQATGLRCRAQIGRAHV